MENCIANHRCMLDEMGGGGRREGLQGFLERFAIYLGNNNWEGAVARTRKHYAPHMSLRPLVAEGGVLFHPTAGHWDVKPLERSIPWTVEPTRPRLNFMPLYCQPFGCGGAPMRTPLELGSRNWGSGARGW